MKPNPPGGGKTLKFAGQLLDFLEKNREALSPLLILPHDFPDPDALAAAFTLHHLSKKVFQIESRIGYRGIIGRMENRVMISTLRIPVHRLRPGDLKRFKQIALVDTQPAFENNPFPEDRRAAIVIDQHPGNSAPAADLALVDTGCGATCVILAQALLLKEAEIPSRLATALVYGILSDTLNFYRAERPDAAQVYLRILHAADMRDLARIQNPARPKSFFITLGRCLRDATLFGGLIAAHLGEIPAPDLVSQMADFLLTYKSAGWSLCTGRYKGRLHVSLRSAAADGRAAEVLRRAFEKKNEAGGHGAIAGGSLRMAAGAPEEAWRAGEQALQDRLRKELKIAPKITGRKPFGPEFF
jgi:nanoRNase/pAp phosphatase (c-di-AMP/oligoRNAs hydrolase)